MTTSKRPTFYEEGLNWFSRILAVGLFIAMCGGLGATIDGWIGTTLFVVVGFIVGMICGISVLIYMIRREEARNKLRGK